MKKMLRLAAVVVVLACAVLVTAGWDQVKRSIYELTVHDLIVQNAVTLPAGPTASLAAADTALQGATFAQVDTNATTTITGYTPAFVGQVLIGGAGTGTNAAWVAKGATTNDWVQVAP